MNKTTRIFVALFCLSSQITPIKHHSSLQMQTVQGTQQPTPKTLLECIKARTDLSTQEKNDAMTQVIDTACRAHRHKFGSADRIQQALIAHKDFLMATASTNENKQ